jgi:hypothetical protein
MQYRLMILEICGLFLLSMNVQGQYRLDPADQNNTCSLTGNLQYDLFIDSNGAHSADTSVAVRKVVYKRLYSPLRAGLFSAVIPGAGQFYTKTYWQSAAFFGAEVLTWVLYATYQNKGDHKTEEFQNYADEHWSVIRYVDWICAYYITTNRNAIIPGGQPANTERPWEYVNWLQLNLKEDTLGSMTGLGFTHRLEAHGKQQYYEMIGKYAQFGGGWDDAATFKPGDITANEGIGNVSPNFLKYRDMRGDANSFYNIATTVSYLIVANHVFSALEAAWNASNINHRIKLQGHIESRQIYGNMVEFVPTLRANYEL